MKNKEIHIKNMVCQRCVTVVQTIAEKQNLAIENIRLGEIIFLNEISDRQLNDFEKELNINGFELINNRTSQIIEKIKNCILAYTLDLKNENRVNLSEFIINNLNYDYSYLSNLFSSIEGQTIEQYFILQRIEKAKELLVYDQLSISEIAYQLGYSSVHHLSAQFKKMTGLTPTYFKQIGISRRKSLDSI